jgi:hypothetical protein
MRPEWRVGVERESAQPQPQRREKLERRWNENKEEWNGEESRDKRCVCVDKKSRTGVSWSLTMAGDASGASICIRPSHNGWVRWCHWYYFPSLSHSTHTHTHTHWGLISAIRPPTTTTTTFFGISYFLDPVAAFIAFDRSLDENILHILLVISTVKLNLSNVQNPNTIFPFWFKVFQCKSSSIIRLSKSFNIFFLN